MKTEIIYVDPLYLEKSENELKNAAETIIGGGIVAFPTETVYGLGGDATSANSAKKIYEAKGRPSDNPLIIHISEPCEAEDYTYTSDIYYKLADKFMPGPLTVVMKAKDTVPLETRGGLSTVAVRCPSHPVARELIKLCGRPVAAPSANLSGSPSPTSAKHVIDDMQGRIDMIIDGGDCDIGLESTIVKLEDDGSMLLLRPGKITPDELACIAPVSIADAVTNRLKLGDVALSPGMKYRHYAPSSPLVLLNGDLASSANYIKSDAFNKIALICYNDQIAELERLLPQAEIFVLGARDNINEQAHHLFGILRDADKMNFDKIYAPLPSTEGVGLALYNRMIRAAAHTVINLRQDKNG